MRVVFLGFALPDDLFRTVLETDSSMPVQTQRFGWAVIDALRSAGLDVIPLSAEPVADYPYNSRWLIRGRDFVHHSTVGRSLTFLNITGFKHVTRYLSTRLALAKRGVRRSDVIVIHGVHSAFLWAGVHVGRTRGIRVVAILTDAPSLSTPFDNAVAAWLKVIDRRLIMAALRRVDGVVALAPGLVDGLAPGKPAHIMEGVARALPGAAHARGGDACRVIYAGGLLEAYGVIDLIESMAAAQESWVLEVYGRGPAEEQVRRAAADDARIRFKGSVAPDVMGNVYASADVLVNPRSPDQTMALDSFPSKLLEYLASGVPVVSTRLPNLPDDYLEHVLLAEPGPQGLAAAIDQIARLSAEERRLMGAKAREFILRTRGIEAQGRLLSEFLGSLVDKPMV